jgi:hypothetical protein
MLDSVTRDRPHADWLGRRLVLVGGLVLGAWACGGEDGDRTGTGGVAVSPSSGGTPAAGGAATGGRASNASGGVDGLGGSETGGTGADGQGGSETGGTGADGQGGSETGGAGTGGASVDDAGLPPDSPDFVPGVEVTTLTGNAGLGLTDGTLGSARFSNPVNLTLSGQVLFVTDYDNAAVRAVDLAQGNVTTLYQNATFCQPFGIVAGGAGELLVETDCGRNTQDYAQPRDGTVWRLGTQAGQAAPEIILEPNGRPRGLLYVPPDPEHTKGRLVFSDVTNHTLGVLDLETQTLSLLAGSTGNAGYVDGVGDQARFSRPYGLALWEGDIVVCDYANRVLRRVGWDGTVTSLAGTGQQGLVDGPVESALFGNPQDVAADAAGNLFVSDEGSHRIRVIRQGVVRTLAGSRWDPGYQDGAGAEARFYGQEGLDVASDGRTVYVADGNGGDGSAFYHHIRVITVPSLE